MSYVSREAANALKEVGFNELCSRFYPSDPDDIFSIRSGGNSNYNYNSITISAPDHLTASDWLYEKAKIRICFDTHYCVVHDTNPHDKPAETFSGPTHRDAAILHACKIIKERK
jgi:hypothetical protein